MKPQTFNLLLLCISCTSSSMILGMDRLDRAHNIPRTPCNTPTTGPAIPTTYGELALDELRLPPSPKIAKTTIDHADTLTLTPAIQRKLNTLRSILRNTLRTQSSSYLTKSLQK